MKDIVYSFIHWFIKGTEINLSSILVTGNNVFQKKYLLASVYVKQYEIL